MRSLVQFSQYVSWFRVFIDPPKILVDIFHKIWKIFGHYAFIYYFCSFFSLSLSLLKTPVYMLVNMLVPHRSVYFKIFKKIYLATHLVGSYFPNQGSNPGPWQWKHAVLTTGLSRNSILLFLKSLCVSFIMVRFYCNVFKKLYCFILIFLFHVFCC